MGMSLKTLKTLKNTVEIKIEKETLKITYDINKQYNTIIDIDDKTSTMVDNVEAEKVAQKMYREALKTTIVEWNLLDENDNVYDISVGIDLIDPLILNAIITKLNKGCNTDFLK